MIPARLGSQRLKQKNLQLLNNKPLIAHAIEKAKNSEVFDEIWVNSEAEEFRKIAEDYSVDFHKRPKKLADNNATSEDFINEFLENHDCDYIVQLHSIAPLLSMDDIVSFVNELKTKSPDVLLSVEDIQIECSYKGVPINFHYSQKTNSQDLNPIQRVTWSITGWKKNNFIKAYNQKECATYSGDIGCFTINKLAAHVIKTKEDLDIAESLLNLVNHGG